ncbi:MAG: hypothetical protein M0P01_04815 [Treponema sp.]|nr:hypothetical protein [Treponema sp.]
MKNIYKKILSVSALTGGLFICTGCTSFTGVHLDVRYLVLLWAGVPVGLLLSDCIWGSDDPGSYTPVWEVIIWLLLAAAGVAAGYVKPFCVFSGFAFSVLIPVAGIIPVTVIVHILKKHRK